MPQKPCCLPLCSGGTRLSKIIVVFLVRVESRKHKAHFLRVELQAELCTRLPRATFLPFTTRETVRRLSVVQNKPVEQSQLGEPSLFQSCDRLVVQGNDGKAGKFNGGCIDGKKGRKAFRNQSGPAKQVVKMARDMYAWRVEKSGNREQAGSRVAAMEWRRIQRAPALCIQCRTDPTMLGFFNACKRQLLPLIFPVHMLPRIAMTCSTRFTFSYKIACMPASYFFFLINRDFTNSRQHCSEASINSISHRLAITDHINQNLSTFRSTPNTPSKCSSLPSSPPSLYLSSRLPRQSSYNDAPVVPPLSL